MVLPGFILASSKILLMLPPVPTAVNDWMKAYASKHLNRINDRGTVAASLAEVREIADELGVKTDEHLDDRTRLVFKVGRVEYELLTWHPDGRPGEPDERDAKIEQLTAELAALRAAAALQPDADPSGLGYSREADDPTPVSPARVPLHTGGVVDGGQLVDETDAPPSSLLPKPIAKHYETGAYSNGPGSSGVDCACGVVFDGFDTLNEAAEQLKRHIDTANAEPAYVPTFGEPGYPGCPGCGKTVAQHAPGCTEDAD